MGHSHLVRLFLPNFSSGGRSNISFFEKFLRETSSKVNQKSTKFDLTLPGRAALVGGMIHFTKDH